jgi:uncharacterized protein (DUF302 family)
MLRIRIDPDDRPREPSFTFPEFGIEKNLHPVADLELCRHMTLFAATYPKYKTDASHDHNAAIDRPLRITSHKTAGQNVNSLEEENGTRKDEQSSEDVQNYFQNIIHDGLSDYTH